MAYISVYAILEEKSDFFENEDHTLSYLPNQFRLCMNYNI